MAQEAEIKNYAKQGSFDLLFSSIGDIKFNSDGFTHIIGLTLLFIPAAALLALLIVMAVSLESVRTLMIILAILYGLAFVAGAFVLSIYLASAYVNLALATALRQKLPTAELKTQAWSSMWQIFVVNFLVALMNQAVGLLQIIPFLGAIAGLVLSVLITAFMAPATFIVVHKKSDPIAAIGASYNLVKVKGNLSLFVKLVLVFALVIFLVIFALILALIIPAVLLFTAKLILLGSIWVAIAAVALFAVIVVTQMAYQIALAKRYLQVG